MNILQKYKLKKEDWYYYGQWEQPLFNADFWINWFDKSICEKMELDLDDGKMFMINGHTFTTKKEIEWVKEKIQRACDAHDGSFFMHIFKISEKIFENHKKCFDSLDQSDIVGAFDTFVASTRTMTVPWTLSLYISDFLGEILLKQAQKSGFHPSVIIDYIPKRKTLMIKQYHEALKIKESLDSKHLLGTIQESVRKAITVVKKDTELFGKISQHVREYGWVGTHHFWGEPMTIEKFLKELPGLKEKEGIHEAKDIEELPDNLRFLVKMSAEMMFLRQYAPEVFDMVAFQARPIMGKTAKSLRLTYDELIFLTPDEIREHMTEKKDPDKSKIEQRKKLFCIFKQNGEEVVLDDQKIVAEIIDELVPKNNLRVSELTGTVASKGIAAGPAKVFLVPENFSKMNAGDVLITPMTTPDFIPLMHKAVAIVTDVGGLLSHAAIVSREMGKPCVIGTKIATKVFKDGDLIEVDADKGIVRKLK